MYYIAQTVFTSNDLKHYGVAGMKWGHHNAKSQNGTDSKAKRKQRLKTAAKVAGATALAGAAAYGAYKGSKYIKAKNLSNQGVADYYNKRNHAKMSEYYTKKANANIKTPFKKQYNNTRKGINQIDKYFLGEKEYTSMQRSKQVNKRLSNVAKSMRDSMQDDIRKKGKAYMNSDDYKQRLKTLEGIEKLLNSK